MNNNSRGNQSQPQLGATFYPGGVDDFYMPEVVSPLPQRSMPEVPQQIQDNLAYLELEAESVDRSSSVGPQRPMQSDQASNAALYPDHPRAQTMGGHPTSTGFDDRYNVQQSIPSIHDTEEPSFSPFPHIHNRPANIPPSDEEKESILENARVAVLNSNDPEMQLAWAQDTLAYVEVAMANESRLAEIRNPRSVTPRVEHQLRVDAVTVVTFLAEQHHPRAEFIRGMWLEFGKLGFRMDKKEAYRCYSRAAQGGYARAEYRMGMQFESSNDIPKAIKHYRMGVDGRDSASHYRLGMMTLLGQHGQHKDPQKGIELIKFAADTADENAPQGAYIYGMLQGRELPQVAVPEHVLPMDIDNALYNIEKAAYLGFAKAQLKMGTAYELCQLGCQFDPTLSLHYNNLAARQGEPEAEMAISKWFLSGYEGVFKKSEELAFIYAQRAAQAGLPTAEFAMGYFYEVGIHVPVSLKEARVWYGMAAEHGNKDAAARIEGITRSKTLSRKDHERIALAKINSARASRRGSRPERFTMPEIPNMPPIPASPTVPDNGPSYQRYTNQNPYSPTAPPSSYQGSAYTRPNVATGSFPLNPNSRPTSTATTGGMPMNSHYGLTSPAGTIPQRPYSAMSAIPEPRYNGGGTAPTPGYGLAPHNPQAYRRTSGGVPPNKAGMPQKPQAPPVPAKERPVYNAAQKPLPNVEIGFTAPPDLSGADRKKRPQRSDNPTAGYPTAGRGYVTRPERVSSRPPLAPQPKPATNDNGPQNNYPAAEPQSVAHRPPRSESMPTRPANNTLVPPASVPTTPSIAPNNTAPPSSSHSGSRKPRKGPSTFEEMGVPQHKKDDDCIVM